MTTRTRVGPLTVRLPSVPGVPRRLRGKPYVVRQLLSEGEDNAKLAKSNKSARGYRTYGLSLAPADTSGYQLCPKSTPGCRKVCLYHQGLASVFESVNVARVAKTVAFMEHRPWFADRLRQEVESALRSCRRKGVKLAVRPNVLSDVAWERVFPWLFTDFPDVTYYDYLKVFKRAMSFAKGEGPPNYHLTFSRSESNERDCLQVLRKGGNVAAVFEPPFPSEWFGFPVIAGDEDDLRFLDPPGHVIALSPKGTAKKDASGFVVRRRELEVTP